MLLDLLEKVRTELTGDVEALEKLQIEAASARKYKLAERYKAVGRTLETRDLLGFLATRNVLPKYGFPVDSVELRTAYSGNQAGAKLDLSRDLTQAIHEYAPDATLVAGGMLWTARGLYRMPGRDLEEFEYHVCRRCGGFWQALADLNPQCPHCGDIAQDSVRKITVPEFGFVGSRDSGRPGQSRPPREGSLESHFSVYENSRPLSSRRYPAFHHWCSRGLYRQGRVTVLNRGRRGRGFRLCNWCGHAEAPMPGVEGVRASCRHQAPRSAV